MTSVLMSKILQSFRTRCEMCVSNWKQIFWPKKIHSVLGFVKPQLRILPFNLRWSFQSFEVGSVRLSWRVLKKGEENTKKKLFSSSIIFPYFFFILLSCSTRSWVLCALFISHRPSKVAPHRRGDQHQIILSSSYHTTSFSPLLRWRRG